MKENEPPSAIENDIPLLLPEKMAQFREMGLEREVFQQLLQTYIAQSDKLVRELQLAVLAKDAAAMRQAAHTMKGASANLGAAQVTALSSQLEEIGKKGSLDGAVELSERLQAAVVQVKEALKRELESEG
jgi:HPt (histidine-containing phosphotransfer) domain-containing protein